MKLFYLFISLLPLLSSGQGNVPKGYNPLVSIIPPDTSMAVTDVYWPYDNQKYLFVKYGYDWQEVKILVVDTDNWKNVKWYETKNMYAGFFGLADNFNILVLQRFKSFLFFTSRKYQFLDLSTGESKYLTQKELLTYVAQKGKLDAGKSFHFNGYVLSHDRNYFLLNPRGSIVSENETDIQQKPFELLVFRYDDSN